MITVTIHDAENRLSSLLAAVEERGEWVRILRDGKPVADLRPVNDGRDPLEQHSELRGIRFNEDPVAPLAPEDWPDRS